MGQLCLWLLPFAVLELHDWCLVPHTLRGVAYQLWLISGDWWSIPANTYSQLNTIFHCYKTESKYHMFYVPFAFMLVTLLNGVNREYGKEVAGVWDTSDQFTAFFCSRDIRCLCMYSAFLSSDNRAYQLWPLCCFLPRRIWLLWMCVRCVTVPHSSDRVNDVPSWSIETLLQPSIAATPENVKHL